jgi:maleate isomerase
MSGYRYRLSDPTGERRLGLIVLQVDETIEHDFRRLFPPQSALHVTRIASGAALTPETIAEMEARLPAAAGLLPPAIAFDAVAYACTSGTTLIGAARVAALVGGACRTRAVTDPLTAAIAAMRALGAERLGIVSPYIDSVAGPIRQAFAAAGFDVAATLSFGEECEARVARIDPGSIADAARDVARAADIDALFLSCTNLRTLDVIAPLEAELGLPVLGSNQVLAWDMARRAGAALSSSAPGIIFDTGRAAPRA